MGRPNITAQKMRAIADITSLTANGSYPTFPTGPNSDGKMLFLGDFLNSEILGFQFTCGALTTITALDCNIEHSQDGTNWHTLKALTQKTGAAVTLDDLDDGDPEPLRYLRATFTATGSYGSAATVKVEVVYRQCGVRGNLAPPGMKDKID